MFFVKQGPQPLTESLLGRYNSMYSFMPGVASRYARGEGKQCLKSALGKTNPWESALKRFKRKCARSGVLAEVRKREHYEKPSVKRKKKAEAARKRKY